MATCIPQEDAIRMTAALKDGSLDINELATLSTQERRAKLEPFMDGEILDRFNRGFEERIITTSRDFTEKTKNLSKEGKRKLEKQIRDRQKKLLHSYVKREIDKGKVPKPNRANILNRLEKVQHMLSPDETQVFLEDYVSHKLGVGITEETSEYIAKLSDKAIAARNSLNETREKIYDEVSKTYKNQPEIRERIADAQKLTPAERKIEMTRINKEVEQRAEDVFNGKTNANGEKLTRKEFEELMRPRLRLARDIEELTTFMGDQHRALEKTTFGDVAAAEGYARAQAAGRIVNEAVYESFALGKSVVASMDFSFLLRQGWQTALTDPGLLAKNATLAAKDMWTTLKGARRAYEANEPIYKKFFAPFDNSTYDFARMEINTRANALNGKYDVAGNGYGLNVFKEESFPSSIAERVPIFGRVFKASEVGYNALALRMRADLADAFIRKMEREGVDMMAKENADQLALLVGSMTGRGLPFGAEFLEKSPATVDWMNVVFFSPRFVGSQFYTLMSPFQYMKDPSNPIVKLRAKKAGQALIEIAAMMYAMNWVSEVFTGEPAIDFNPASTTFGHARFGDYAFDMTGAHGSVIALVGKMIKMSTEGKIYHHRLGVDKDAPFTASAIDLLSTFFINKTSPTAGVIKEFINQANFGEDDFSWARSAKNLLIPLTLQISAEAVMKNPDSADTYLVILGEIFGVGSKEVSFKPASKDWKELKELDSNLYNQAAQELTDMLYEDVRRIRDDRDFQEMTEEEQEKEIERMARRQKAETVDKYLEKAR